MSKAILVVDIDDMYNIDDLKINYLISKNGKIVKMGDRTNLKPMPTRKLALFDPNHCDMEKEIKIIDEINGYNKCIDEILGETK